MLPNRPRKKLRAAKFTAGFLVLSAAIVVSACSSYGNSTGLNIGPSFPSMTLYASNSNQNALSIYTQGQKSGTGPAYQISGTNTTLNGPQYLAFDSANNLWSTNYNPSTNVGLLVEIEALATGDVEPLSSTAITGRPRGIAITAKPTTTASPPPALMVVADVNPTATYPSSLMLFVEGATTPYQSIAGPLTSLNVPSGVALDSKDRIYVTNLQGKSVQQFVLPTPSPTPKPTHTPSPTPSPSTKPSSSPSPSPSPSTTPMNLAPTFTIFGKATGVNAPTGVAVNAKGDMYVADQGRPGASCASPYAPAVLVFPPQRKGTVDVKPLRKIQGCATLLYAPTDVKVDSAGRIYVADYSRSLHKGVIYIYPANANGTAKPAAYYTSSGAVTGLGLVP